MSSNYRQAAVRVRRRWFTRWWQRRMRWKISAACCSTPASRSMPSISAEMAIRNLALHLDKPGRPRAYLQLQPGQTIIEIADGPQVYLSRRVMQDYDVNADIDLLQAQMENLALEVQRSLDYFESQYALGPADQLSVIVSDDVMFEAFSKVARTFLTVQTERFSFSGMPSLDEVDLTVLGHGVTAVGAAMRGLPWAA